MYSPEQTGVTAPINKDPDAYQFHFEGWDLLRPEEGATVEQDIGTREAALPVNTNIRLDSEGMKSVITYDPDVDSKV